MDPATLRVKVFHQTRDDGEERRFQTGDPLREVVAFDLAMVENTKIHGTPLERVWFALVFAPRFGAPARGWVLEYRRRGNRQLRVGDVVVVGEQAWAIRDLVHANPSGQTRFSPLPKWEPVSLMGSKILTASSPT